MSALDAGSIEGPGWMVSRSVGAGEGTVILAVPAVCTSRPSRNGMTPQVSLHYRLLIC